MVSIHMTGTIGVALWYAEQPRRATESLTRAYTLAPAYAAPAFNLAYIARDTGQAADAQAYQRKYEQLVPSSVPAPPPSREYVEGVGVGQPPPPHWQASTQSPVPLEGRHVTMVAYRNGVMALLIQAGSQAVDTLMLMVGAGYPGTSTYGIRIGSQANEVLARYGVPSRRVELPSGQSWAYDAHRIAFQLRDGHVVSWLVF